MWTQTPDKSFISQAGTSTHQPRCHLPLGAVGCHFCHPTAPLPVMSGLSSISRSAETTVLSRVRTICSRNSGPKCFSTQAYCKARGSSERRQADTSSDTLPSWFVSGKGSDAAGEQASLLKNPGSFWHHDETFRPRACKWQSSAEGREATLRRYQGTTLLVGQRNVAAGLRAEQGTWGLTGGGFGPTHLLVRAVAILLDRARADEHIGAATREKITSC